MIKLVKKYFDWLQQGNFVGEVEALPAIDQALQTSVNGVYIAGDLTGVPLLNLASQSGGQVARQILSDPNFAKQANNDDSIWPVIIIGAGPSGVSAAMEFAAAGIRYLLLEGSRPFNTIENFPAGKPIIIDEQLKIQSSPLQFDDGTKESLLEELKQQIETKKLVITGGQTVNKISSEGNVIVVSSENNSYKALRVILAIGKSGNSRKLKIPGEELPKVFNQLYDPHDFCGKKVLVIGGGDSAIEAAVAIAECGGEVTHSYRQESFARPKETNIEKFNRLVEKKAIKPLFSSEATRIDDKTVTLKVKTETVEIENDVVFALIGKELPRSFFKRSNIKMTDEKDVMWYLQFVCLLSFFVMLYFGKKGFSCKLFGADFSFSQKIMAFLKAPWLLAIQEKLGFFSAPFEFAEKIGLSGYQSWLTPTSFLIGWVGAIVFLLTFVAVIFTMVRSRQRYLNSHWNILKYLFLGTCSLAFFNTYLNSIFSQNSSWVNGPTQMYAFLYCVVMVFFGIRRIYLRKTRYVAIQTFFLCFIQVVFLYILPFARIGDSYVFDLLITNNFAADSSFFQQVFPIGRWTSFWFILFWPLSIEGFGATTFWTIFPIFQHLFLFMIIYHWGKGAYCGWICSCGGMAETLGDEYRTLAWHGAKAKKIENIGQIVLLWAVLTTILKFFSRHKLISGSATVFSGHVHGLYLLLIDIVFAGVLGLGVYFFLSGRVWCRFGCPLAAIMHIMSRFSRYRIFSEKKKCISCNICTKVCHMGIDVMGYANKGIPMNDVECVRCSACVHSCPMKVLAFGKLPATDLENSSRQAIPDYSKDDWRAGIV